MPEAPGTIRHQVRTIGHSDLRFETFLSLLEKHGVDTVVDIRSRPRSRFPWFNRAALEHRLAEAGMRYVFLGAELGGLPADLRLYSLDGAPDYYLIGQQQFYLDGIAQLMALIREGASVALMCGEADPMICHRERLVGRTLREQDVEIVHILREEATQQRTG